MDVFETSEKAFKICSEFLDLGGFSRTVEAFKYYKHGISMVGIHKDND
jgi:hypothetical protein